MYEDTTIHFTKRSESLMAAARYMFRGCPGRIADKMGVQSFSAEKVAKFADEIFLHG